jgi:beta-glucuronidase
MLRLFVAVLGLVAVGASAALPPPPPVVLTSADMRPHQSLDGAWHWSVDPFRDGMKGFHGGPPGESTKRWADVIQADVAAKNPTKWFEFDMQQSPTVQLPGAWIGHSPEMRHYNGLVWYQRTFDFQPQERKRTFVRFGAVDYRAEVYVNGEHVGRHFGGFTPFAVELSHVLRPGSNQITVGVDSERGPLDIPPIVTDWENYGGITRSISLIIVPELFIDDAWVRLTSDDRIAASVRLNGSIPAGGAPVRLRIPSLGVTIAGTTDQSGNWTGAVPIPRALRRWSPANPTLYDVQFEAGEDVLKDRVGFRTVEVRGQDILVNGKPIFLRGISMHEEELGENPVRRITPEAAKALLTTIKQGLHGNFVRLAHYPHSEVMLRAADELGLFVWSEIPVYWQVEWSNPGVLSGAQKMLRENISRDRNRASIILWSVGNETPLSPARNAFMRALVKTVRDLDDSRLVTAALLAGREGNVQTIDDPLAAELDVLAVNTYNGWYSGDPLASLPSIQWRSPVAKPLIFSEFGADAKAGYHDDRANPHKFSEDYQAEYYRQTLAMARKVPFLRGLSPWILKDFRSPRRQHPIYQQGWNRKGLISPTGERKQAFGVLAEEYRKLEAAGR